MTRDEKIEAFKPYVRDLADRMCLKDWRVDVSADTPDDKGDIADVSRIPGSKSAVIRVSLGFFEESSEDRRTTACHELVHLHMTQLDEYAHQVLTGDQLATYGMLRELAVDELAHAIAPGMPLPPVEAEVAGPGMSAVEVVASVVGPKAPRSFKDPEFEKQLKAKGEPDVVRVGDHEYTRDGQGGFHPVFVHNGQAF